MGNDFVTSYAADEHSTYAARFHRDLVEAVAKLKGHRITAAMCPGGRHDTNHPLIAEAGVLVALCSPSFYKDEGCGKDWAVFEHRLNLEPAQWRPAVPPARVLVRWQPADPPSGVPRAPIMSGEVTDSYACIGVYGIMRRKNGLGSEAYKHAVERVAAAVCAGSASSPPRIVAPDLPELAPSFPRGSSCCGHGRQAKVPPPRSGAESPKKPRVFVSYAHEKDGDFHKGRVKALYDRLIAAGFDAHRDVEAHKTGPKHWARWMREQFKKADVVLVIVSPAYKRRAEHEEEQGEGDGVAFEADYIIEERKKDRKWLERILLVAFPEHSKADVPDFLAGVTVYTLDPETGEGDLADLLDYIRNKARRNRPPGTENGPLQ